MLAKTKDNIVVVVNGWDEDIDTAMNQFEVQASEYFYEGWKPVGSISSNIETVYDQADKTIQTWYYFFQTFVRGQ